MPVKTEVTCDVCGEQGRTFPAFFFIDRRESWVSAGVGNLMLTQLHDPEIRTDVRGFRHGGYIGGDHRGVCLCGDHFKSLVEATKQWLDSAVVRDDRTRSEP